MQPRRITLVADELLGYAGNGLGTATTFLAVALARMGHEVEVLYFGKTPTGPVASEWRRLYERVDVRVRPICAARRVGERRILRESRGRGSG